MPNFVYNKRTDWITLLGVVSCISVVFLHINGCFHGDVRAEYWISANIIECVFYFAAPTFFMITGATLLNYRERYSTKTFFAKRLIKVVIPYLIWSGIAIGVRIATKELNPSDVNFKFVINSIVTGSALPIYWFFPPLIIMYLLIPILSSVDKMYKKKIYTLIVVLLFTINSFLPFILSLANIETNFGYLSTFCFGPLMYVCLGYLIKNTLISRKYRIIIYSLGGVGFLTHLLGTYFLSVESGQLIHLFKGYYSPFCVFYTIAIFTLFKQIGNIIMRNKLINKITYFLSKYTLVIYLSHSMVMIYLVTNYLYNMVFHVSITDALFRYTSFFFIVPPIILATYLLRKIPFCKYILPE